MPIVKPAQYSKFKLLATMDETEEKSEDAIPKSLPSILLPKHENVPMSTTESEHPMQLPSTPTSPAEKEQIPQAGCFSANKFLKTTTKTFRT